MYQTGFIKTKKKQVHPQVSQFRITKYPHPQTTTKKNHRHRV